MTEKYEQNNILSLLEKAANSSSEGITISILSEEDRPLIYANEGFVRLTGYRLNEVIGKNCRFLQGADTKSESVDEIRRAIKKGEECTVELLNYKKDGTPFWNRLSITPLKDQKGRVTHYVGIQSDITELNETKRRLENANYELSKFHDRISQELDQASKAQQFILPNTLPKNEKVRFSALHKPMDVIGGDYYDVIELSKGVYGIMISDVTGHGIPAALLTFMTSFAFKNSVQSHTSTAQVVASTNKKLINKMPRGAFITMFYAIYDSHTKVLRFTQAGHPQGLILRAATKEIIPLATDGKLVGVFKNDKTGFGEEKTSMQVGDKLVLYTDAIVESRNRHNEMLEINVLHDFLIANSTLPISELFDKVYQFGIDFSGKSTYDDDFTLVGLDVLS
jgi:sigma-B regulation protein RsbU (phosphoserine phosphatase)